MNDLRAPKAAQAMSFSGVDVEEITAVSAPRLAEVQRAEPIIAEAQATLTLFSGPNAGAIFTITAGETLIGRGGECAIGIDDPRISRKHAKITRNGPTGYLLEDLGSSNGTFVRGERVSTHLLWEGDRIRIGTAAELRFGFADESEIAMFRHLFESSVRDPLTGAYNRKHFAERLHSEVAYSSRHQKPLSVVVFDLDHFKRINDSLGHLAGDQVLRSLTALVTKMLRREDVFARIGGEEFAIISRGIDEQRAYALGERIRTSIASTRIEFDAKPISVSISVGVASLACCTDGGSADDLVLQADRRLYAAKGAGRNRTVGAIARA